MTQETKFRAWHKTEKIMCDVDVLTNNGAFLVGVKKGKDQHNERCIVIAPDNGRFCPNEDIEIIQSTGLQSWGDGRGLIVEDAYFGDIIEFYNTEGHRFVKDIRWNDELMCINLGELPYYFYHESGFHQPSKIQFRILGNIYRNKQLLEK